MPVKYLFIALSLITVGCNNNTGTGGQKETSKAVPQSSQEQSGHASTPQGAQPVANGNNGNWQKLVMRPFRDNKGALLVEMPMPENWKVEAIRQQGDPGYTGPHNLKITDYPAQSFMYTNDPRMQQVYYQSGQRLRQMPGIEQIIKEDIAPQCASHGFEFVKWYEIPEVTKIDKWYNDQLYKAVPMETKNVAVGTEWKNSEGKPYFILMHLYTSQTAELNTWYYMLTDIKVDADYFEQARIQWIFTLANAHYALEPIMAYNQSEAQKAGRSWAQFNQRMAQNQASFEANQRAHVNRTEAINNAIMSGWRDRNAAMDKNQERTIDGIYERTNVVNTETGQQYKVAAGSNQYWMNNNGEYIATESHTYNPNLDENMNNVKWQELQEIK